MGMKLKLQLLFFFYFFIFYLDRLWADQMMGWAIVRPTFHNKWPSTTKFLQNKKKPLKTYLTGIGRGGKNFLFPVIYFFIYIFIYFVFVEKQQLLSGVRHHVEQTRFEGGGSHAAGLANQSSPFGLNCQRQTAEAYCARTHSRLRAPSLTKTSFLGFSLTNHRGCRKNKFITLTSTTTRTSSTGITAVLGLSLTSTF